MLIVMMIAVPFVIFIRLRMKRKQKASQRNPLREAGIIIFGIYLVGLFYETIIPKNGVSFSYAEKRITDTDSLGINLHLFRVFTDVYNAIHYLGLWQPFFINFLGNIAIFMPIGFLLPMLWRKMEKFFYLLIVGFCLSLFIETMQLPQYRSTDVDDLWLNTLGALLGFLVYHQLVKRMPWLKEKFKRRV